VGGILNACIVDEIGKERKLEEEVKLKLGDVGHWIGGGVLSTVMRRI